MKAVFLDSLPSVLDIVEPTTHAAIAPRTASPAPTRNKCTHCDKPGPTVAACYQLRQETADYDRSKGLAHPFVTGALRDQQGKYKDGAGASAAPIEAVTQHISAISIPGEPPVVAFKTVHIPSSVSQHHTSLTRVLHTIW